MELELLRWGDSTIRLAYWDSLHGKDRIFILLADGQAFEEDADDVNLPVNLAAELHKMALRLRVTSPPAGRALAPPR